MCCVWRYALSRTYMCSAAVHAAAVQCEEQDLCSTSLSFCPFVSAGRAQTVYPYSSVVWCGVQQQSKARTELYPFAHCVHAS